VLVAHIALADAVTDLASSRSFLRSYADKAAADTGRIEASGWAVSWSAESCSAPWTSSRALVTRATRVIIDWAIEERGIHRVEWQVSTANKASSAVAHRLGMTREGVLRESYPHRGERHDIEVWSVLAPEWRSNARVSP
jgi:ribosomal-protein-serine acetyltransferase